MAMSRSQFERQVREAQRKAQREIDRVNRANKKAVDDYNREVERHNRREIDRVNRENKKAVDEYNRKVEQHNREADRHNQKVVDDLNRQLAAGTRRKVSYRPGNVKIKEINSIKTIFCFIISIYYVITFLIQNIY